MQCHLTSDPTYVLTHHTHTIQLDEGRSAAAAVSGSVPAIQTPDSNAETVVSRALLRTEASVVAVPNLEKQEPVGSKKSDNK